MNLVQRVAEKKIGNSKWQPHLNKLKKLAKKGLNLALYKTKNFLKIKIELITSNLIHNFAKFEIWKP